MKDSLVGEMAVNSAKQTNSENDPIGPTSLTRQELHALVWAHPVSHLARGSEYPTRDWPRFVIGSTFRGQSRVIGTSSLQASRL
jgi:hypothetical protein